MTNGNLLLLESDFDFSKLERPANPHCKDKRFNHKLTSSTDMKLYVGNETKAAGGSIFKDISVMKNQIEGKAAKDD